MPTLTLLFCFLGVFPATGVPRTGIMPIRGWKDAHSFYFCDQKREAMIFRSFLVVLLNDQGLISYKNANGASAFHCKHIQTYKQAPFLILPKLMQLVFLHVCKFTKVFGFRVYWIPWYTGWVENCIRFNQQFNKLPIIVSAFNIGINIYRGTFLYKDLCLLFLPSPKLLTIIFTQTLPLNQPFNNFL